MAYSNGLLPRSALLPTRGGHTLRRDAALALNALDTFVYEKTGRHLGVIDGYRILGTIGDFRAGRWSQWGAWEKYRAGVGNLAAYPGTSNHGWALAIDLGDRWSRLMIDKYGAKFGWSKSWSDAPSEWWHIKFDPAKVEVKLDGNPSLAQGSWGPSVVRLKKLLELKGVQNFSGAHSNNRYNPYFNKYTKAAVTRFQLRHGLSGDGIVGPATWEKLA